MLEIHGRAQAVDLGADEGAGKDALQKSLIIAARGVASGGSAAVAVGDEFEGLRLGCAHAAGDEAQALRALLHFDHGAHQVALFAPELQQAAAVRLGDGVAREAHVEENAAVFKQSRGGMIGEIVLRGFGRVAAADGAIDCGGHALDLPVLPRAQIGDVRGVMARVPRVEGEDRGQILTAAFRMVVAALEIRFGQGFEQRDPARVQRRNQRERASMGRRLSARRPRRLRRRA